jgi:hypothetical protein
MDAALNASSLDRAFGQDHKVEVIERFDETFDELFETVAASVPCVPEKDSAFLSWRYGPNSPQGSATVLGVKESGRLLGYAVFWVTAEGRDGHLLDLMTLPGRRDVARALLRESSRRLRHSKVNSIKYRFVESSTSPLTKDAWPLGFYFSKKRRFALLIRFKDLALHQEALNRDNWTYNFGDSETTFWLR